MIEGALLKTALTLSNPATIEQQLLQVNRKSSLNRGQAAGPADVFATKDGWVMCLVIGRFQFERWCNMVGRPELLNDERFKDDQARGDNGEALSAVMAEFCANKTNTELLAIMDEAKVPGGPINKLQDVLEDDHIDALGFLTELDYPTAQEPARVADFPVSMSASPGQIRSRAPELGEHTDEILTELGYDADAITELRGAAGHLARFGVGTRRFSTRTNAKAGSVQFPMRH